MWPHLRPWRFGNPQPAMRCIADVKKVAAVIVAELKNAQDATPPQAAQSSAIPAPALRRRRVPQASAEAAHV
jgi:hypothetical protein